MSYDSTYLSSYDIISFTSKPSGERHPNRMASVAYLGGVSITPISSATILELGCSTGDNLLPIASAYSKAKFIGIDASEQQIETAKSSANYLGLKNVDFYHLDFLDQKQLDNMLNLANCKIVDYIICHGMFSWVKDNVREQILKIAATYLSSNGLLYLNYNTLPRNIWRESIKHLLQTCGIQHTSEIGSIRKILRYTNDCLIDDLSGYATELKREIVYLEQQSDSLLFHELLGDNCKGFYLSEVESMAREHGLTYIGDARPSLNRSYLDLSFIQSLYLQNTTQTESIRAEQFRDMIAPISLRASLFVKNDRIKENIQRIGKIHIKSNCKEVNPLIARVKNLYVSSSLVPMEENMKYLDSSYREFSDPRGYFFKFSNPIEKIAIQELSNTWPEALAFESLLIKVKNLTGDKSNTAEEKLAQFIYNLFCENLVDLFLEDPQISTLTCKPMVLRTTHLQSTRLGWSANLRHEYQVIDPFTEYLLPLLDGTRNEDDLLAIVSCEERWSSNDSAILKEEIKNSLLKLEEGAFLLKNN